jgi:epoxyqueuosine reductase
MQAGQLKAWAAERGYRLELAGIEVLETVLRKLQERRTGGLIDPTFYKENLSWIKSFEELGVSRAQRVVVVVVPSPVFVLPVRIGGRVIETLLPPTYFSYKKTFDDVLADMRANALVRGEQAALLKVPLKSLAVHLGLTVYGRNNITYASGFGSGLQVLGFIAASPNWRAGKAERKPRPEGMLAKCLTCRACVKACPTGAIREDRFLIAAERCFTLHSESRRPIPEGTRPPKKAICLVGCLDCQLVCPENKGRLRTEPSGVEFTAEETMAVLESGRVLTRTGEVPGTISPAYASARVKFDRLGLSEDLAVMGRNLAYVLADPAMERGT